MPRPNGFAEDPCPPEQTLEGPVLTGAKRLRLEMSPGLREDPWVQASRRID